MQRVPSDMGLFTTSNGLTMCGYRHKGHCPSRSKEFFPVVVAAHLWGVRWANRRVCFQLDNASVVYILNSRTSRENHIMALLRSLLGVAARCIFTFEARHIPGVANPIADALSRFNWQVFRQLAPECSPVPTPIPHALLHELVPRT